MSSDDLIAWEHAQIDEINAGRLLDTAIREKRAADEIQAAESVWHAALQELNDVYRRLNDSDDLELAIQLARVYEPERGGRPVQAFARALLGVQIATQKRLVREYRPQVLAGQATRIVQWWAEWQAAEECYASVKGDVGALIERQILHTIVRHFRLLAKELVYLRIDGALVSLVRRQAKAFDESDEVIAENAFSRMAELYEQACAARTKPFDAFVGVPAVIARLAREEEGGDHVDG